MFKLKINHDNHSIINSMNNLRELFLSIFTVFVIYNFLSSTFAPSEQFLVPTTVWFTFSSALVVKYWKYSSHHHFYCPVKENSLS